QRTELLCCSEEAVVEDTINVGAETAAALKAQVATDRCIMAMLFLIVIGVIAIIIVKVGRLILVKHSANLVDILKLRVNIESDFTIHCLTILNRFLKQLSSNFQLVNPNNKDIADIPGLPPPANRKLL
ncbi:hypothetical protein B296_00004772, partial [Ensete ventricosum]